MSSSYYITPGLASSWQPVPYGVRPDSITQYAEGHIAFLTKNAFTKPQSSNGNVLPSPFMAFVPPNTAVPPPQLTFVPPPLLPPRSEIGSHIPRIDCLYPSALPIAALATTMDSTNLPHSDIAQCSTVSSSSNCSKTSVMASLPPPTIMYSALNHSDVAKATFATSQYYNFAYPHHGAFLDDEQKSSSWYQLVPAEKSVEETPMPFQLPPNWKRARDSEGNYYYYHVLTRETSWDLPSNSDKEEDIEPVSPTNSEQNVECTNGSVISSAADTSCITEAESLRNAKIRFRTKMSEFVVQHLNHYRRADCNSGRITCTEDFNHLAKKLTQCLIHKELKRCNCFAKELEFTDSVKNKARDFIRVYMLKYMERENHL